MSEASTKTHRTLHIQSLLCETKLWRHARNIQIKQNSSVFDHADFQNMLANDNFNMGAGHRANNKTSTSCRLRSWVFDGGRPLHEHNGIAAKGWKQLHSCRAPWTSLNPHGIPMSKARIPLHHIQKQMWHMLPKANLRFTLGVFTHESDTSQTKRMGCIGFVNACHFDC